jgi:aspartate/tyrosine/aromatic aminotransferase
MEKYNNQFKEIYERMTKIDRENFLDIIKESKYNSLVNEIGSRTGVFSYIIIEKETIKIFKN